MTSARQTDSGSAAGNGQAGQAAALATRAAALDDPDAVARLLDGLRWVGAHEQAAALLARDPAAHAALDSPYAVASLLDRLREAGADEQAAALATRAAAHTPLDDPAAVARLLDRLREAGADEQAAALASRAAAHDALGNPDAVARLLDRLREAGADEQAAALADRLPAAGLFGLYLEQEAAHQFRFGREADGTRPHDGTGKTWTYGLYPAAGRGGTGRALSKGLAETAT